MPSRLIACLAVALALPTTTEAQRLAVAGRVGTFGAGGEAAIELTDAVVVRGGVGFFPLEPTVRMDGIAWSLELADRWYNAGVDLYLNRVVRLGGGVLFKPTDPHLTASLASPVDLGGRQFTPSELGTLSGMVDIGDRRPYGVVGFGRHTSPGRGLFLDLGAVWLGDSSVHLDSEGGTFADPVELDTRLRQAESDIEDDLGAYLKVWLIMSIGVRVSVG